MRRIAIAVAYCVTISVAQTVEYEPLSGDRIPSEIMRNYGLQPYQRPPESPQLAQIVHGQR